MPPAGIPRGNLKRGRRQPIGRRAPIRTGAAAPTRNRAGLLAANKRKILENARKFAQKGAKDKALKEYQKLVQLDPKDAKLRLEIGDAYRRWGQVDEETFLAVVVLPDGNLGKARYLMRRHLLALREEL